jgi:methylmalonyl-CoA mutase
METMYQRGKIQEESWYYERKKHDGSLPLIGVNTFLAPEHGGEIVTPVDLVRSSEEEKHLQIANVDAFRRVRNRILQERPAAAVRGDAGTLPWLQRVARDRENVFAALMEAVKFNSLGQISHALYDVGGEYRRSM